MGHPNPLGLAKSVWGLVKYFREGTNQKVQEVRQAIYEDMVFQVQQQLKQLEDAFADQETAVAAALDKKLDAATAMVLCERFFSEGINSPTSERRRMFAAAFAGVFVPDVETEMKSRALRAICQLEPSDVAVLREIADARPLPGSYYPDPLASEDTKTQALALSAAGCIEMPRGGIGSYNKPLRSPVGDAVVAMVRTWTPQS